MCHKVNKFFHFLQVMLHILHVNHQPNSQLVSLSNTPTETKRSKMQKERNAVKQDVQPMLTVEIQMQKADSDVH